MRIDEATGAKLIVVERCTGCGECARACPFNKNSSIVKFDQSRGVYVKCDLCLGRDGGPICVEICQMGALRYIKAARG
jgi:Fe-S-cluster-containing hydrogenase component 2